MNPIIFTTVCLALAAATCIDLRSQRIPNALTIPTALAALAFHALNQGPAGFWFSAGGLGLGFGLMLAPFLFGVMGGGDLKLMAAVGAWLGPQAVFTAFLATSIAGGLYALAVLAQRRDVLRSVFLRFTSALYATAGTGEFHYRPAPGAETLPRLCYGLAISLGTLAVMIHRVLEHGWLGQAW
ncbi:MAG: A24 family peptidase [Humidesulfovibrio sp.]|uniref:A24 family peptidase n=1 Tax=Humidesulfovibrio sp. TaxID=2910988 RepID=UPI002732EABA|nr:A24 family peptidase [Humidesulfovibrio sp.]MDP2847417.1 A24 family peptidase [Humidesulfovibrio sp.]